MSLQLETVELPLDVVEVGRIVGAWGVKGWFKVLAYSATPEALFSSKQWYLLPPDQGARNFAQPLKLQIKEAKDHSGGVVASAHSVEDRSAAEDLRGARVHVRRSSFPTTTVDEYYWVDLIGLNVVNREGVVLGQVADLSASAAQTVLVVHQQVGDKVEEFLIPFVAAFVDAVDISARLITVDWQMSY